MKDFRKATPRPWQSVKYQGSENHYHIFSQPDKSVMYQSVCSANKIDSALIIAAVNNFDKMKEALEEILRFKDSLRLVMSDKLQYPDNFLKSINDAEQLLESLK